MKSGLPKKYDHVRQLSTSASARWLSARDRDRDGDVAVKVLVIDEEDRHLGREAESVVRFQTEFRLLSLLSSPHLARVLDFGWTDDGQPFYSREVVAGQPLSALAKVGDWAGFARAAIGVARAQAAIEAAGNARLVVRPSTVVVIREASGVTGLVTDVDAVRRGAPSLEQCVADGSIGFLAPEEIRGHAVDRRADFYSLGATLYAATVGGLPVDGAPTGDAIRFALDGEFAPPSRMRPDLPPRLEAAILRLLAKSPMERPSSSAELIAELAAIAGEEVPTAAPGEILRSPLVGRRNVTELFDDLLQSARIAKGGAFAIVGDAGSGKSHLLTELAFRTTAAGGRVWQGGAIGHQRTPYRPFADVAWSIARDLGERVPVSLAEIGGWLSGEGPREDFGRDGRHRAMFFERVARALGAGFDAAGDAVAVVLVDDFHLVDVATVDLFSYLVRALADRRVIFVVTLRPGGSLSWDEHGPSIGLAEHLETSGIASVTLAPLGEREIQELAGHVLGSASAAGPLAGWLTRETSGHPEAVLEAISEAAAAGALLPIAGGWQARTEALPTLGTTGFERFERAVRRLSPPAVTVMEAASAAGDRVGFEVLAEVVGGEVDDFVPALDELVEARLFDVRTGAARGGWTYGFVSEAFRFAIYQRLDADRRRRLHDRVAHILDQRPISGDRPGALAFHLGRGSEHLRGAEVNVRAGQRAESLGAFDVAVDSYRVALDLLELAGDDAGRASVRERLADLHCRTGRDRPALAAYHFLLESVSRDGDAGRRGRLTAKLGRIALERREWSSATARFREALALLSEAGDRVGTFDAQLGLVRAYEGGDDAAAAEEALGLALEAAPPEAIETTIAARLHRLDLLLAAARGELAASELTRAEELIRSVGSVTWEAELLRYRARVALCDGRTDAALLALAEAAATADRQGDPWLAAEAERDRGELLCRHGRWIAAEDPLNRYLRLARILGDRPRLADALVRVGEVLEVLGRWDEATRRYREALDAAAAGSRRATEARAALGGISRKRGQLEAALKLAREARQEALEVGDELIVARLSRELAQIDKDAEDWEGAKTWLDDAAGRLAGRDAPAARLAWLVSSADLELRRGRPEAAEPLVATAAEVVAGIDDGHALGKVRLLEARIAHSRGDLASAEKAFAEAVDRLEEAGARYELGKVFYEWGVRSDQEGKALELLERSVKTLAQIGASLEVERVRGAISRIQARGREGGVAAAPGRNVIGLWEMAKVLNSSLDLEEVLHRVLDLARERLKAERGLLVVLDPITSEPKIRATKSVREEEVGAAWEKLSRAIVDESVRTGRSILSADIRRDKRFAAIPELAAARIVSVLAVPVAVRDRIGGAIYLDHTSDRNLFDTKDLAFLEAFADQAAIAIENARLFGELELARSRLSVENETLREEVFSERHLEQLVGRGETVARIQYAIRRASASNATVLIRGESGTGKGLVARLIHAVSPRANGPFIKFNCAALPETLAESELFGHEKGSFTGADRRKLGRFELSRGGTIFLDEIGKVSLGVQSKLLRVVEDKEFERVGGTETIKVDTRILSATNLDIEKAIERNEFREDLFYRLNIVPIFLPPLRERLEDIPVLAEHFVRKICQDMGQDPKRLAPGVMALFRNYPWPGNVRELEAAIHRAIVMSGKVELEPDDFFWMGITERPREAPATGEILHPAYRAVEIDGNVYNEVLERVDRELIERAMQESGGKIREAARRLGLARNTLRTKLRRWGMSSVDDRP